METKKFDLSLIQQAEEQAEEDRQNAMEIHPQIQGAIAFLESASGASREARERLKEKISEAQNFLSNNIRHEVPAVRRGVWRAIMEFELTRPIQQRSEVEELLANLEKRGFIQEDPDGYLRAYGKTYHIPEASGFGATEKNEVLDLLKTLLQRAKEEFLHASTISLKDLFKGEKGDSAMEVPPEKVVQGETTKWLGGGILLVHSDGENITPQDAMGSIENGILEAKELRVRLLVSSLSLTNPPFIERLDPQKGGKVRLLWRLIKRAKRMEEEKESFSAEASLSQEEFFLQGKEGICLVDLGKEPWEAEEQEKRIRLHSMFFLVFREGAKIKIKVPTHLQDFFGACTEEYPESDKFSGTPQPLRAVLRAVYGKALKADKEAKKAELIGA